MRMSDLRVTMLLVGLILSAGAWATPILAPVGATAAVEYEGPVFYTGGAGVVGTFEGTLVDKSQTAMFAVLGVTYATSDFDFNFPGFEGGFRWTETITNNTTSPWTRYSLQLGTNGVFFQDATFPTPTFATVVDGSPPSVTSTAAPGTATLSAGNKRVDLVFASSIDPGESFSLHIPIYQLATGGGTFQLAETAVPEPGSLALLGAALGALGFARRR